MKKHIDEDTYIMCEEPYPDVTLQQAKEMVEIINNERELAQVYAIVHNKAWWIEDSIYDFDEGTKEYEAAEENVKQWFDLTDYLTKTIFQILKSEGTEIPKTRQIIPLTIFMERNGYLDGQGWWLSK